MGKNIRISTKDLTNELMNRDGIKVIEVVPYEEVVIQKGPTTYSLVGPAIILINQD